MKWGLRSDEAIISYCAEWELSSVFDNYSKEALNCFYCSSEVVSTICWVFWVRCELRTLAAAVVAPLELKNLFFV